MEARKCGNCVAWCAIDQSVDRAPCPRILGTEENQGDRPLARVVNRMSERRQPLARNIEIETPRDFCCNLHVRAPSVP